MKITAIKSYPVEDAAGGKYHFIIVETDAGISGIGEVGIRFWGAAIEKAVEHLSEIVSSVVMCSTYVLEKTRMSSM